MTIRSARRALIGGSAAVLLWFLGADRSFFLEECDDCGLQTHVSGLRLAGFIVSEKRLQYPTVLTWTMRDLGIHRTHRNLKIYHRQRWWGLCICANPCVNGIVGLSTDTSWYNDDVVAVLTDIRNNQPVLVEEFRHRVLAERNLEFFPAFVQHVREQAIRSKLGTDPGVRPH